jgi:hypothetical protein
MAKKISSDEYLKRAHHGARVLVEVPRFRVVDGDRDDKTSVFIFDDVLEDVYLVSKSAIYEVLARALCVPDRTYVIEEAIKEALGWVKGQSK